jgi:hypothetical protein
MSNRKHGNRIFAEMAMRMAFFCVILIMGTMFVHADTKQGAYELQTYKQETTIQKDHQYDVTLEMTINAPKDLSSVRINLPSGNYLLSNVKVSGGSGKAASDSNDNKYIQVTPGKDKASFPEGENVFEVSYTIWEYGEENTNYDIFYYDALVSNWNVAIGSLDLTLNFPDDFDFSDLQYYAGQYGAQDVENSLDYKLDGTTLHMTGTHLPENFGITFKAQLPDGYWQGTPDNSWTIQLSLIVLGITTLLIFLLWLIGGRDTRVRKTQEQRPIEGVKPSDIGFLLYGHTRIRDIAILIIYMAIQGYLRIVEYAPKKFTLVRLKDPKGEERYIRMAYNILFDDVYEGRSLDPSLFFIRLRAIRKSVGTSIENGFGAKNMKACTTISQVLRLVCIVILSLSMAMVYTLTKLYSYQEITVVGFICLTVLIGILLVTINRRFDSRYDTELKSYQVSIGLYTLLYVGILAALGFRFWQNSGNFLVGIAWVVCGLISLLFTMLMKKRGKGNAKLVTRILCLRDYISSVNSIDLAKEHRITPEYYYEMMPYALSFSQEETWARKFRWLGPRGSEFLEVKSDGNTMATDHNRNRTEGIARDLKNFCRTVENDYHMTRRKGRLF